MRKIIAALLLITCASVVYADDFDVSKIKDSPAYSYSGEVEVPDFRVVPFYNVPFHEIPYDVAKKLPDHLYFWWAIQHNNHVQNVPVRRSQQPGVQQTEIKHDIDRVLIRQRNFAPQAGSEPVMIYNPFFR